ncbi:MAG: NAD(P)-dependent oxidoreductase [Cyanobacteria bacterium P01_G01_bin.38]
MKLLITGSSGFLGKYVVAAALQHGHHVRAVVRPASSVADIAWANHPHVEFVKLDLRKRSGIAESLESVDAVIHLAATKAGDFYAQFAGTVVATENLLAAMTETGTKRLVAISTFSVYDYINMQDGAVLDEAAPVVAEPLSRDEYTQTKLLQEQLIRDFEKDQGGLVTILRPGVIYGRDNLWTARLGATLGENAWLRIGAYAKIPLTYVENCAAAIVLAAEREAAVGQTLNVVDDNPPTQRQYAKQLVKNTVNAPRFIPVNFTVMYSIGMLAWAINQRLLGGKAKLPGILVPSRLQARFKSLKYSNQKIKQCLGWEPQYSLKTSIERSFADAELLTVDLLEDQTASIEVKKNAMPAS